MVNEAQSVFTEILARHGYAIGAEMGEGTYSKVKHCTWTKPGETPPEKKKIAIKIINKKTAPKDFLEKFLPRELEILRKVHHPNVVQTFEIITINHKVFIALEWAGKGDLLAFVRLRGSLKENDCRRIFTEMSTGIKYLHENEIVHRDLKCENVLICSNNTIKIADFGFAQLHLKPTDLSKTFCGSAAYAAPELLQGTPYIGTKADIWSMGVILYIMICSSMPFRDSNIKTLLSDQRAPLHIPSSILPSLSKELKDLLLHILSFDHNRRITMEQIFKSRWMNKK
ncbi:unnamed protein product [Oikopleura dioica]|uniref:non-specific serine/threonine protein kinase n=1 Tax=Oikopleura dioica TaxID=34765 RepID=E4X0D0_OIKDI|nr:unnamed protein product [Oikopleura dioica]